jgi:hypothetical protein
VKSRCVAAVLCISGLFAAAAADAQEIITAERYLEIVGERCGDLRDYAARIVIRSGNTEMFGSLSHLAPSFLRIDFAKLPQTPCRGNLRPGADNCPAGL